MECLAYLNLALFERDYVFERGARGGEGGLCDLREDFVGFGCAGEGEESDVRGECGSMMLRRCLFNGGVEGFCAFCGRNEPPRNALRRMLGSTLCA